MTKFFDFVPTGLKHRLKRSLNRAAPASLNSESARLFSPSRLRQKRPMYHFDHGETPEVPGPDGLPVPPRELRMGYATESDEYYCAEGLAVVEGLREALVGESASFRSGRVLELGCATGRVLRHFSSEAETGDIWGVDQHEDSIQWAKENLSPPFNFLTTSRTPHLNFEDHYFSLIYSISVFTHIEFLVDSWLMELRRVMRPDALLLVTVFNEDSVAVLRKGDHPFWLARDVDFDALIKHGTSVVPWGVADAASRHDSAIVFYRSDYLREEWGRYFEVKEIRPCAIDGFQTLVILKKRS